MKNKYFITLALLFATHSVLAVPLLEKITTPGFVMAEYAISKSCVIHRTGSLVITRNLAQLSSTRTIALKLNLPTISSVIKTAALGSITTGIAPVDGGRVEYHAYQLQADGSLKKVVLWEDGEGSSNINNTMEAKMLRNFIDLTCGDPLLY
jgi:hypothetical protein